MTGGTDYNDVLANADLIIKNAIAAAMPINAASEPLGTLFFKRSAVNYVLNSPLIVKPSFTGNPAMPSMIGEGVGAGIEISTDPNGPVTFQPSNSFPSGEYLLAYLPNTLSYSIKGAKIAGLAFFGQSPDGTNRGAGANFVNTRQFRITDLSTNFTVAPAPVLTTLGESASAALNISQSGSPGGFDYIDGCTSTKAGQDGIYFQSAESTMVACRVLAHTRIGYNINSFDMALFGCMIDSGGGSAGNPQIYIAQGGNDDTRIVGFNSFAGPLLGGPTVFVSSQAGDAQHPVFTASRFNGPQQAGLGDNGAIILLTGACDIDFIGCDFSALSAAQTTYFIRGRSDFTGKCRIIGGRFNRKNNAVTAVISTVGASGIIVCRDVGNFNPLGLLSTPYDNTNNWIGYLGGSSTLTSATVAASTFSQSCSRLPVQHVS